jgi:hypothetical protein
MTNLDLRSELKVMLEGIVAESSRGVYLADLPPPPTKAEREEIVNEFRISKARMWADVCRCVNLAGDVELETGLTDENQQIVEQIREIHDVLVRGEWPRNA